MDKKFLKLTNTVYNILEFFPESDPLKHRAKDRALVIMEHLILVNETSGWMSFQKEKIKSQVLEDIDILLGYLWIGKSQGWLNSVNFLIISNEYEKVKKEIEPVLELTQRLPGIDSLEPTTEDVGVRPDAVSASEDVVDETPEQSEKEDVLPVPEESEGADNAPDDLESAVANDKVGTSERQIKILEFLDKNEKAQVMDLQKILPDVTKRTIRRDLDELLEDGRIVRKGDFNQVFYQIAQVDIGGLGGEEHLVG